MDSALGRFKAPDPVGPVDSKTGKINDKILTEPQRLNAYAYGLNGPGRYVDRDGKNPLLIVAAAVYLLLHNSDVANAPTSPSEPTYASNGAGDIAADGGAIICAIEGVKQGRGAGKLSPSETAEGPHSTFKRDPDTGKITHYETYRPQTNPRDPKPWETETRYDGEGYPHYNKETGMEIETPHVHDPTTPGGVRPPQPSEIPGG
jgi:hypothetical protein